MLALLRARVEILFGATEGVYKDPFPQRATRLLPPHKGMQLPETLARMRVRVRACAHRELCGAAGLRAKSPLIGNFGQFKTYIHN